MPYHFVDNDGLVRQIFWRGTNRLDFRSWKNLKCLIMACLYRECFAIGLRALSDRMRPELDERLSCRLSKEKFFKSQIQPITDTKLTGVDFRALGDNKKTAQQMNWFSDNKIVPAVLRDDLWIWSLYQIRCRRKEIHRETRGLRARAKELDSNH